MARPRDRNRNATELTITALRAAGRLEPVDDATVGLVRTLAQAIDDTDPVEKPAQLASLARVHLATLRFLRGLEDEAHDSLEELMAKINAADPEHPMGDASTD